MEKEKKPGSKQDMVYFLPFLRLIRHFRHTVMYCTDLFRRIIRFPEILNYLNSAQTSFTHFTASSSLVKSFVG
jgi:hypothetical protein